MTKVITDKKRVAELLTRGVERIYPNREALEKKLLSGEKIRLYCGYDPTAAALHIGNAISINKLGQFQALGHEVIFLIGDFTGLIGDPTDKKAARRKMTREEVLANARDYQKQASAYLKFDGDNPAKIMYNSAWNGKLNFADVVELAANFTVQQMIQRDMFQERIKEEKPIYLHEFLYPLTQGYDSVAMEVDLEIGGNDQMFNMLCGRDLLRAVKKKEKFVMTLKLLADENGHKMGKSEGNAVFLDEKPHDMYGQIMSWPDGVIIPAFELCTNVATADLVTMAAELKKEKVNPRDLKMKLAREITTMNHGSLAADEAQANFVKTVQKKEMPTEMPTWKAKKDEYDIGELVVVSGLAFSNSEARRLIEQKAIKIMGKAQELKVVDDFKMKANIKNVSFIQRGKLQFRKIIW
ncbi:TPA: tyrosine--tRNA ligase [Candidatus Falkowbacteria bacterium]|nr:MAG: Tyrosine-tRNA ligase [Candidatus Falkowbacteria bacterium GW2011_GWF2_43_32]HBA36545.1 tyrosine--tRNA ligase [Candidatus Falkowbacteria bacterium]